VRRRVSVPAQQPAAVSAANRSAGATPQSEPAPTTGSNLFDFPVKQPVDVDNLEVPTFLRKRGR